MTATDMTTGGSADERLRWAFKMYDKDGSGRIEKFEMEEIIMILYELNGEPKVDCNNSSLPIRISLKDKAKEAAESLFSKLDKERRGEIDEEQFIAGCLADPSIQHALSNNDDDK